MKKIRNLFLVAAMIAAAVSFPVFGESFEAAETGVPAEAAVFAEGAVSAPEEAAVFAEAAEKRAGGTDRGCRGNACRGDRR